MFPWKWPTEYPLGLQHVESPQDCLSWKTVLWVWCLCLMSDAFSMQKIKSGSFILKGRLVFAVSDSWQWKCFFVGQACRMADSFPNWDIWNGVSYLHLYGHLLVLWMKGCNLTVSVSQCLLEIMWWETLWKERSHCRWILGNFRECPSLASESYCTDSSNLLHR